jgi:hypothetical protein
MEVTFMLTQGEINTFINICEDYQLSQKETFARIGKKIAREIAKLMGLAPGTFDIHYRKSGSVSLGDLWLHTDSLYLTLDPPYPGSGFMYRSCKSRNDYTGGRNRWAEYSELRDLPTFVEKLKQAAEVYA